MSGADRGQAGEPARMAVPVSIDPCSLRLAFLPPPGDSSDKNRPPAPARFGIERAAGRRAERDRRQVLHVLDELIPVDEPTARIHCLLRLLGDLLQAEVCRFEQVEIVTARRTTILWPDGAVDMRRLPSHGEPNRLASPIASAAEYRELFEPLRTRHQLAIPLRLDPTAAVGCTAGRSPRPFSNDEHTLATALQLALAPMQLFLAHGGADTDRAAPPRTLLTAREQETLSLLATGLTAKAIARACGVSPSTTRKHLEHLYAKLGVNDRLSAVNQARSLGLLPSGIRQISNRSGPPGQKPATPPDPLGQPDSSRSHAPAAPRPSARAVAER